MLPGMSARPLESALAITGFPSVLGLSGKSNAGSPTTKFDVTASRVMTVNQRGKVKVYNNVGTKTVDLSVIGIGGRDQTAAFSEFAEPNIFYVPDGKGSVGLILSLNDFITGPNGFPEFTPVMPHKLNGGAQFYQGTLIEDYFELTTLTSIVSAGAAAFPTSASYANMTPSVANAKSLVIQNSASCASSGSAGNISSNVHKMFSLMYLQTSGIPDSKCWTLPVQITSAKTIAYGFSAAVNATNYSQKIDLLGWYSRR